MKLFFTGALVLLFLCSGVDAAPNRKPASKSKKTSKTLKNSKPLRRQVDTLSPRAQKKKPSITNEDPVVAQQAESEATIPKSGTIFSPVNLSAGTNFGLNYLFTTLHFQLALFQHWVIGAMPVYSSSSLGATSANAIGGIATLSYYIRSYFEGVFVQTGVGATSISATSGGFSERKTSVLFSLMGGWRFTLIPHLNLGFGAGVQYATDPGLVLVDINFRSFRPVFTVDLGYNF